MLTMAQLEDVVRREEAAKSTAATSIKREANAALLEVCILDRIGMPTRCARHARKGPKMGWGWPAFAP